MSNPTLERLINKYNNDHQNKWNRALHMVGVPVIIVSVPLMFIMPPVGISLFVGGWVLQFIGHGIEGNKPSFMSDPRFLMVGALFFGQKWKNLFSKKKAAS